MKRALEAFIGSVGILIAGVVTIPFAASVAGATINPEQGIKMGAIFFVLRFVWLYALRVYFTRINNG